MNNGPEIHYARKSDKKFIADVTEHVVRGLMRAAGVNRITVTSTYRSPEKQADLMYGIAVGADLKNPGIQKSMYKPLGENVMDVARKDIQAAKAGIKEGFDPNVALPVPSNTKAAMTSTINRLELEHGMGCISRHQKLMPDLNVFDLAISSLQPASALDTFIETLTSSHFVKALGIPKGKLPFSPKHFVESEPCVHVEMHVPLLNDGVVSPTISRTA